MHDSLVQGSPPHACGARLRAKGKREKLLAETFSLLPSAQCLLLSYVIRKRRRLPVPDEIELDPALSLEGDKGLDGFFRRIDGKVIDPEEHVTVFYPYHAEDAGRFYFRGPEPFDFPVLDAREEPRVGHCLADVVERRVQGTLVHHVAPRSHLGGKSSRRTGACLLWLRLFGLGRRHWRQDLDSLSPRLNFRHLFFYRHERPEIEHLVAKPEDPFFLGALFLNQGKGLTERADGSAKQDEVFLGGPGSRLGGGSLADRRELPLGGLAEQTLF